MTETLSWDAWSDVDGGPLPAHDRASRQARLRAGLSDLAPPTRTTALLVSAPSNIRWLTGFSGSNGMALVLPDRVLLLTDSRYAGRAAAEAPQVEAIITRALVDVAIDTAVAAGVDHLTFEGEHLTYRAGTALLAAASASGLAEASSVLGVVEQHRVVKDAAELAALARACAVSEAVLVRVLGAGLVGHTERFVARIIEDGFRQHGADVAFSSIVAAGPNGAVPHHDPTDRVIERGDLVTLDCGAAIDGYHADTTRTVAAGALPAGDGVALLDIFEQVAQAQERGVSAAVAGAGARAVDAACRDHLADVGLGDEFLHGTGHGVGLDIHEAPAVASTATATLASRMALTVEPGVYRPGTGGVRIEDTVVVAPTGPPHRLTHAPRTLLVV